MMIRSANSARTPRPVDVDRRAGRVIVAGEDAICDAAWMIRNHAGVVGYPTETQYGLAVDPFDHAAVQQLYRVKQRRDGHPIGLVAADRGMVEAVTGRLPRAALDLMERFWPGPLTLLLPAAANLPRWLVNDRGELGIRVSSDAVACQLALEVGGPITATSANLTGQVAATVATAARLNGVAVVLDDGPREAIASTVARCEEDQVVVLRQGAIVI